MKSKKETNKYILPPYPHILLPDQFIEVAEDMVDSKKFFWKAFEGLKPEKHIVIEGVEL